MAVAVLDGLEMNRSIDTSVQVDNGVLMYSTNGTSCPVKPERVKERRKEKKNLKDCCVGWM